MLSPALSPARTCSLALFPFPQFFLPILVYPTCLLSRRNIALHTKLLPLNVSLLFASLWFFFFSLSLSLSFFLLFLSLSLFLYLCFSLLLSLSFFILPSLTFSSIAHTLFSSLPFTHCQRSLLFTFPSFIFLISLSLSPSLTSPPFSPLTVLHCRHDTWFVITGDDIIFSNVSYPRGTIWTLISHDQRTIMLRALVIHEEGEKKKSEYQNLISRYSMDSIWVCSSDFLKLESQTWITNQNAVKKPVTVGERSSYFSSTLILAVYRRLSANPKAGHDNDIIESWLRSLLRSSNF